MNMGQSVELTPFKVPKEMSVIQRRPEERSQLDEIEELVNDVYQSAETMAIPTASVTGAKPLIASSENADFTPST